MPREETGFLPAERLKEFVLVVFTNIDTCLSLYRSRKGPWVPFSGLKNAYESATGHRLLIEQLLQLQHLMPELYSMRCGHANKEVEFGFGTEHCEEFLDATLRKRQAAFKKMLDTSTEFEELEVKGSEQAIPFIPLPRANLPVRSSFKSKVHDRPGFLNYIAAQAKAIDYERDLDEQDCIAREEREERLAK